MYFVNLTLILLFLIVCVYFDLKDRIISNKILKLYSLITIILVLFEIFHYLDLIFWYIFIKLLVLIFIFILVFTFFNLKLLGGGDGKVLILIFQSLPFMYIFYFLQYFFLVFGLFLVIVLIFNYYVNNKIKNVKKREKLIKISNSIIVDDSKFDLKIKELSVIRKKYLYPLLLPIFFSYITMTLWLLFIL